MRTGYFEDDREAAEGEVDGVPAIEQTGGWMKMFNPPMMEEELRIWP